MEKMLITMSDPQAAWLRDRAAELDIPISELVRRVLDQERERVGERARTPQQPGGDASETDRNATTIVAEDRDDMAEREAELTWEMKRLYRELGQVTGSYPNRYRDMVWKYYGGLGTARILLHRPLGDRLNRVAAVGRLDLSVEALVLDPRFADLFTPEERAIASTHLAAAQEGERH